MGSRSQAAFLELAPGQPEDYVLPVRSQLGADSPALPQADRGCLVIADISGYTTYLMAVELEHANDVLADLTETVLARIEPVLTLSKLEGDAWFAYALEGRIDGPMLLDAVDQGYFAFRRRLRDIEQATSCPCNACRRIPELNLKFALHHGSFIRRTVAGGEELTGGDVILVHRLLKNQVAASLGMRGYALYTERCLAAMGIDPVAVGMSQHHETYDDVGRVEGYVDDLERRWHDEQERRRVRVAAEEAAIEVQAEIPAAAPLVWHWVTSPLKRPLWQQGTDRVDESAPQARRGVGTVNHCVHGEGAIREEILDWMPFRYFTLANWMPGGPAMVSTIELEETGGATRVSFRTRRPEVDPAAWREISAMLEANVTASLARLAALLSPATDEVSPDRPGVARSGAGEGA